jgi:hypothetical protein
MMLGIKMSDLCSGKMCVDGKNGGLYLDWIGGLNMRLLRAGFGTVDGGGWEWRGRVEGGERT